MNSKQDRRLKNLEIALTEVFDIVGLEYQLTTNKERFDFFGDLKIGTKLLIKREKRNKADKNACAIYRGRIKIGYIPRRIAKEIAPKVDEGATFFLFVSRFNFNAANGSNFWEVQLSCFRCSLGYLGKS
jgi:hypothetical protein